MESNELQIIRKLKRFGIVNLAIIMVVGGFIIANQVNNDTWDGDQWGGDTGEQDYTEPPEDDIIDGGGGLCGSVILFGVIYDLQYLVSIWKVKK